MEVNVNNNISANQAAAAQSGKLSEPSVSFAQVQAQAGQNFQAPTQQQEPAARQSVADGFEEIVDQALEVAEQRRQARLDQAIAQANEGRPVAQGSVVNLLV